jgi:Mlc titration factor MtfA (ptsG expression regulator)
MIFSWLKRRRRRRILSRPFPAQWLGYLEANVAHYHALAAAEQAKLRDDLRLFIADKHWEGCAGLRVTDEMKVTIAAQACLLTLAMDPGCYDRVRTILVYPTGFRVPDMPDRATGLIAEHGTPLSGQAWYRGPVILSWDEVLAEGRNPGAGHNLVFHEFTHQLDMLDGSVDGTPPLRDAEQYRRWREVMTAEFRELGRASDQGRATLLDQYGATDEAEFFAVATECFFNRPAALRRRHPHLYDVLRQYYRQDPATRRP